MRKIFGIVVLLSHLSISYGYTDYENCEIARTLIKHSIPQQMDNLMSDTIPVGFEGFVSTNDFFGMSVDGLISSQSIRQQAFDFYLNNATSDNGSSLWDAQDSEFYMLAIDQCARMGYTNEISALRRFVFSERCPMRHLAIPPVVSLGGVDAESLDFVMRIGTNSVAFTQRERNAAWREFAKCVRLKREANLLSASGRDQIARIIYGLHIADWPGVVSIDEILCVCNETYGVSSNRCDSLNRILAKPDLPSRLNVYFSDITNQLMNASQPLPEVEAFRGL